MRDVIPMPAATRRVAVAGATAALLLATSACAGIVGQPRPAADSSTPASTSAPSGAAAAPAPVAPGGGVPSISSTLQIEARDMRLVRSSEEDVALQFELANNTGDVLSPLGLGLDPHTHVIVTLVDLPRGTGYAPAHSGQNAVQIPDTFPDHERISMSSIEDIAPGAEATVSIVFPAPPPETTSMMVLTDIFQPVELPVQPIGSPALRDDPVLHGSSTPESRTSRVAPVLCSSIERAPLKETESQVQLRTDSLFDFGSAKLSPGAAATLGVVAGRIGSPPATVTITGHTDAIGDDASNQALSEKRAAAVKEALAAELVSGFTLQTEGAGEKSPIAQNNKPDGSDDPDGRAQNRRVELTVARLAAQPDTTGTPTQPVNTKLEGQGLVATVQSVAIRAGFALAQVELSNTGAEDVAVGYLADTARVGEREDNGGELTLLDGAGRWYPTCGFEPAWWDLTTIGYLNATYLGNDKIPPGGKVHQWALFIAPGPAETSVNVGVGGLGTRIPAPLVRR
ncbi:OmpA family protein [Pseudonocardia sp. TRM90224]|uniref:OmpA family protein n=1 Tax=Pseudonocardia sp. TRM90224 TaxID=2812678 RepID=UPI001E3C494C|nr:OmpA family protein [Pseudonocardia sp. TRM90224]